MFMVHNVVYVIGQCGKMDVSWFLVFFCIFVFRILCFFLFCGITLFIVLFSLFFFCCYFIMHLCLFFFGWQISSGDKGLMLGDDLGIRLKNIIWFNIHFLNTIVWIIGSTIAMELFGHYQLVWGILEYKYLLRLLLRYCDMYYGNSI